MQSNVLRLFLLFNLLVFSQPGTLDTSFGTGGFVISPSMQQNFDDTPNALVVLPGNKILTAGYSITFNAYHAYISKHNADGTPDLSFGTNGKFISSETFFTQYYDMIVDPDGKILVCGIKSSTFSSQGHDCFVARFNPNGSLDSTFGVNGYFTIALSTSTDYIYRIVRLTDNRYVGLARYGGGSAGIAALVMLTSNGSLDASFGNNGRITHLFSATSPQGVSDLAISQDNKILALGGGGGSLKLNKYNLNGSIVNDFGVNGTVTPAHGRHIEINSNGSILVLGATNSGTIEMVAQKYLNNGTLDTSFGNGGSISYGSTGLTLSFNELSKPFLYPDGSYLRTWRHVSNVNGVQKNKVALTWFNANGSLSSIGQVIDDISTNPNEFSDVRPECIAMDSNGDLITTGYYQNAASTFQYLMKYRGNLNLSVSSLNNNFISIYPNPTDDILNLNMGIRSEISEIKLFDNLGHLINEFDLKTRQIYLSNLPSGIFLLKISNLNNESLTFKIIKK